MNKIEDIFSFKEKKEKPKTNILVDIHEKNSLVLSYLLSYKCKLSIEKLEVGDYIIGEIVLERKTILDFLNSLKNKRLKNQLKKLSKIKKKCLIIENKDSNKISDQINKSINTISLYYQIPIIFTKDEKRTADLLKYLSEKEMKESVSIKKENKKTPQEKKEIILQSFPFIGPKTSKKILSKYKTLKEIFNLPEEELKTITNKRIAKEFYELINCP